MAPKFIKNGSMVLWMGVFVALFMSALPSKKPRNLIAESDETERLAKEARYRIREVELQIQAAAVQYEGTRKKLESLRESREQSKREFDEALRNLLVSDPLRLSDLESAGKKDGRSLGQMLFERQILKRLSDRLVRKAKKRLIDLEALEKESEEALVQIRRTENEKEEKKTELLKLKADLESAKAQRRSTLSAMKVHERKLSDKLQGLISAEMVQKDRTNADGKLDFDWPAKGPVVQTFGSYQDPTFRAKLFHKGVRIRMRVDDSVRAIADGTIIFSGVFEGYGKLMIVRHENRYYSLFANVGKPLLFSGDHVRKGEPIALASADDEAGQSRVIYFELRKDKKTIDPQRWIRRK